MDSTLKGRFPNLNQTKSKQVLSFYHDCMLRVFDNHASRKSEYLGNVLLSTAKSGDVPKLCKALEKVDLTKIDFNLRERNTENTPLMIAAEHGHDEVIDILLSCGSDVTLRNAAGETVVENCTERITELILDSVTRPGAGQPLLCQAAWQGNATVVKKLLHLNPNLNVNNKNSEGLTPLLLVTRDLDLFDAIKLNVFAENYNPTEVVSLLLHQNADCTVVDKEGRSALHFTARNHGTNARNIISLLARKDSLDVDLRDTHDFSALHFASETGDPNILLALIDNGADVNARGPLGRTPLHVTASRGDERTSVMLVEHGANVLLVDDLGFTPVDVAKGSNVQVLLKEAWTEHSQMSLDSIRIKSAPVVLPLKLDHLDTADVTELMKNKDESGDPLKKTLKKNIKRLQSRSHSEEQAQPLPSFGLPRRVRSHSSGPSPRSRLDPISQDSAGVDETRQSPLTHRTVVGKTTPAFANKIVQAETVPRPMARVAVLNIDLKGPDLHKQKSKSCSELPFTRYRAQKLSNLRVSMEVEPLDNPLSLRGRSVSAASLSSFETLPGITTEDVVDNGGNEMTSVPELSPVPDVVVSPPAAGQASSRDDECPSSPETDVLNKTFNTKEKLVFWFPGHTATSMSPEVQNSSRGFFVDWKKLEVPLQKCTKCREEFKPEDIKPGSSVCNLCYKDSIAKDTFWVPFGSDERTTKTGTRSVGSDERNTKTGTLDDDLNRQTAPGSTNVDDRTVCIEKKTSSNERRKKFSEGSLVRDSSPKTKEVLKKTFSDTSHNRMNTQRGTTASKQQSCLEAEVSNDNGAVNCSSTEDDCEKSNIITTEYSSDERVVASQKDFERKTEAVATRSKIADSFIFEKDTQSSCKNTEERRENNAKKIPNSSVEIHIDNVESPREGDLTPHGNTPRTKQNTNSGVHWSIIKEFEKSKQTLQCLCADMKCLEQRNLPDDLIGRLYNQSTTGKDVMECGGAIMDKKGQNETVNLRDLKQQLSEESKKVVSMNQTVDTERSSGIEIDEKGYNGVEMDKTSKINMDTIDHLGTELVNTDVTTHQVVIVNPFPSPVPPKTPVVNVTSNCQCDRYASFAKNPGTGGKKKGRAKKGTGASGQKTGASYPKTGTNAQNTRKIVGKKEKSKQSTRVISAGKAGKKRLKELQNAEVKEISVIQTQLISEKDEENSATPRKASNDILGSVTVPAPVRQTTFVKEKFPVLSPIPEASRSESSVPDSAPDVYLSEDNNEVLSRKRQETNTNDEDNESGLPSSKDHDIPPTFHENADYVVAPAFESRLTEDADDSRPSSSEPNGKNSEIDGNLDELIEEILTETDELENNHGKSRVGHTSNTKKLENSENDVDKNYELVSNWLLGQDSGLLLSNLNHQPHRYLAKSTCDSSGSTRKFSDNCRGSSGYVASSSGNCEDSSDPSRTIPSDTTPTDSSSSDCSSNDTTTDTPSDDTSGRADPNSEKKLETSLKTSSEKRTISGTDSQHWSSCSVAISLLTAGGVTLNGEASHQGGEGGGLVHSRLSRRKSETSMTSSEISTCDEEEIVWKKGNMLGKGAFGEVYCGLTNKGEMIAVKQVELITSNMEQAERQYEKLQEEVALLKSLRHTNVVSYLGTCLDGGVVNIFMEFVPGGSIASILARFGPLEERVFRIYTKQILVGVEYLHKMNVVHRDIKGGNIMLMPTGVIKLIDFGCAKRLYMNMSQSQGDLLRSMKGTPYWMAPEVIRETGYGRKSDIWSIGCTVFEMATGKPPWSHMPPMSAILAIGQGSKPPKLEKPYSGDACDFVAISMAGDPDERWSAVELLSHPFILKCDAQR